MLEPVGMAHDDGMCTMHDHCNWPEEKQNELFEKLWKNKYLLDNVQESK